MYSLIKQWILLSYWFSGRVNLTFHIPFLPTFSFLIPPYSCNKSVVTFYKKDISCLETYPWNIGAKYINILLCNNVTCKQNSNKCFFFTTAVVIVIWICCCFITKNNTTILNGSCLVSVTGIFYLCFCQKSPDKCKTCGTKLKE